jgi:hypothetical protein
MSCIAYLCQQHHNPELLHEEITENVLAGTYILNEYATSYWLELVERCLHFNQKSKPSSDLIHLLETLLSERVNYEYEDKAEDMRTLRTEVLKSEWPDLHDMLSKAIHFRHVCSTSQHRRQTGMNTWDFEH